MHSIKARQCISSHCSIVTPKPHPRSVGGLFLYTLHSMKARQCISLHCSIVTPHPAPSLCRWFVLVHTALYEGTPVYLASLLHRHTPPRTLALSGVCSCTLHSMKARQCISSHCSIVTPHPAPSLCWGFVLVHCTL